MLHPVPFVETLADLSKKGKRNSLEEAQRLAVKTPLIDSFPCSYHTDLRVLDLLGKPTIMNGRIPVTIVNF